MKKTLVHLADGRELFFFDHDDTAVATNRSDVTDARDLEPASTASEIRHDVVLDEWVTIASHRQTRTHLPPADECPLCPSRDGRLTEVPTEDYDVVVFENRFPSFTKKVGRCEVVCFTSEHDVPVSKLSPARLRLLLDVWIDRSSAMAELPSVKQVYCFENRGEEIGVTLSHPHGQIYGYPFVTPRTEAMLESARTYRQRTGRDVFADRLEQELVEGNRVVATSEHWVAFVPFAARWPIEVHLYPRHAVPDLPSLGEPARDDFPGIYLQLLGALDSLYDAPLPYISGWHQAPLRVDRDLAHLHLEVFSIKRAADKVKFLAASESGMGAFINDITPERAAAMLRDALPR